jgi:hypothetical protein
MVDIQTISIAIASVCVGAKFYPTNQTQTLLAWSKTPFDVMINLHNKPS